MSAAVKLILPMALLAATLAACGRAERSSTPGVDGVDERAVRYERRLWFVSGAPASPAATTIFDFSIVQDAGLLHHHSRAWLRRGASLSAVLDTVWQTEGIRDPWRLLPQGPLRLLVDNGGGIEALIHGQGSDEMRLLPGRLLAAWVAGGTEIVLSAAELRMGGNRHAGVLLDTRVGSRPGRIPDASATASRQAFVSDGDQTYLLLWDIASDAPQLWLRDGGDELVIEGARLDRVARDDANPGSALDGAWVLEAADGAVRLELWSTGAVPGRPDDPNATGYYLVEGSLVVEGGRRAVSGLVRDETR